MMANYRFRPTFNRDLNNEKLEQALLFFLHRANNDFLGKTKLMKLLYFADFDHYEEFGAPITGARYRKLDNGPVPDEGMAAIDELHRKGRVVRTDVPKAGYIQHHYEPEDEFDRSVFSESELAVLESVAARWREHTTQAIVAATHGEAPWIAAEKNEEIPYYLAHYRNNFGAMELDEDEAENLPTEDEIFAR